jgi:hypothetical protein
MVWQRPAQNPFALRGSLHALSTVQRACQARLFVGDAAVLNGNLCCQVFNGHMLAAVAPVSLRAFSP